MLQEAGLSLVAVFDPHTIITFADKGDGIKTSSTTGWIVRIQSSGHGKAHASAEIGEKDDTVFLFAEPEPGYKLKEWQVLSGDVTISENCFQIGSKDVEIRAVFVPKGE